MNKMIIEIEKFLINLSIGEITIDIHNYEHHISLVLTPKNKTTDIEYYSQNFRNPNNLSKTEIILTLKKMLNNPKLKRYNIKHKTNF